MNETLLVEACEGRHVPIHQNDVVGGNALILRPGDGAIEVVNSTGIRRRIRAEDLRIVKSAAVAVKKAPVTEPAPIPTPTSEK